MPIDFSDSANHPAHVNRILTREERKEYWDHYGAELARAVERNHIVTAQIVAEDLAVLFRNQWDLETAETKRLLAEAEARA